jgi:hypothetical protein
VCRACGQYLRQTKELDFRIESALKIRMEQQPPNGLHAVSGMTAGPAPRGS